MATLRNDEKFYVEVFVTGMHLHAKYGYTVNEITRDGFNAFSFINHHEKGSMEMALSRTIEGLSLYLDENPFDAIVVHGDRVEALAGSVVGAIRNTPVVHIEGGEVSGTIDESIRHAVSKFAHVHFVANSSARDRLIRLGEDPERIRIIGSPDIDIMHSSSLPSLDEVKMHYEINDGEYVICIMHPVTTKPLLSATNARNMMEALKEKQIRAVIIRSNNDLGSALIDEIYDEYLSDPLFQFFPSIRFEAFLTLLKEARFIIGNSSAGIREAPHFGTPSVDIGSRQTNRASTQSIFHAEGSRASIESAIELALRYRGGEVKLFGDGNSAQLFHQALLEMDLSRLDLQKSFSEWIGN